MEQKNILSYDLIRVNPDKKKKQRNLLRKDLIMPKYWKKRWKQVKNIN